MTNHGDVGCHAWKPRIFSPSKQQQQQQAGTHTAAAAATAADVPTTDILFDDENDSDPMSDLQILTREHLNVAKEVLSTLMSQAQEWPNFLKQILLYKSPVGIVTLFVAIRLVRSGRIFTVRAQKRFKQRRRRRKTKDVDATTDKNEQEDDENDLLQKQTMIQEDDDDDDDEEKEDGTLSFLLGLVGRAKPKFSLNQKRWQLDSNDGIYNYQGGIQWQRGQTLRHQLDKASIMLQDDTNTTSSIVITTTSTTTRRNDKKQNNKSPSSPITKEQEQQNEWKQVTAWTMTALNLAYGNQQQDLYSYILQLLPLQCQVMSSVKMLLEKDSDDENENQKLKRLLLHSTTLLRVRFMDAILRLQRNHLLVSCVRFQRQVRRYKQQILYATSSLGGRRRRGDWKTEPFQWLRNRFTSPWWSSSSLRDLKRARKRLAVAQHDLEHELELLGKVQNILLQQKQQGQEDDDEWNETAQTWLFQARTVLKDVLGDLVLQTLSEQQMHEFHVEQVLQGQWWSKDEKDDRRQTRRSRATDITTIQDGQEQQELVEACLLKEWKSVVRLVHHYSNFKQQQQRQSSRYLVGQDGSPTEDVDDDESLVWIVYREAKRWIRRINVFGIPLALVWIRIAYKIHESVVVPYGPTMIQVVTDIQTIAWTVLERRIWQPLQVILQGLTSRTDQSMLLQYLNVTTEVTALDDMLSDLGFLDRQESLNENTSNDDDNNAESKRQLALERAAKQYTRDLENGVITNLVRGRLVRLLLLQVQQLKAGLLHALESMDVLVTANRLNVQLVAAIPAFILLSILLRLVTGTIQFVLGIGKEEKNSNENQRRQRQEQRRAMHLEMTSHLQDLERILIPTTLRQQQDDDSSPSRNLGLFCLSLHCYLKLLDVVSPSKQIGNEIHESLQDILNAQQQQEEQTIQLGPPGQEQWQVFGLVKTRHDSLFQYL